MSDDNFSKAEQSLDKFWNSVQTKTGKTILVIICMIFLTFSYGYISTLGSILAEKPTEKEQISQLTFSYQKKDWLGEIKEEKTEIIKTTFELFIYVPPYFTPKDPKKGIKPIFYWHGDPLAKCAFTKEPVASTVETNNITSSAKYTYEAMCETYKPIIDNEKLFSFKE